MRGLSAENQNVAVAPRHRRIIGVAQAAVTARGHAGHRHRGLGLEMRAPQDARPLDHLGNVGLVRPLEVGVATAIGQVVPGNPERSVHYASSFCETGSLQESPVARIPVATLWMMADSGWRMGLIPVTGRRSRVTSFQG